MLLRDVSYRVIGAMALSLALILASALRSSRPVFVVAAILFCAAIAAEAFVFNRAIWRLHPTQSFDSARSRGALRTTSVYSALVYAWGASAMFLSYAVAGLPWQHGWQYGLGMAVIASGMAIYLKRLDDEKSELASDSAVGRAVQLAALQGIAMGVGLVALLASGKLTAEKINWKADWAANIVFAAGAMTLAILSALIVATHRMVTRGS